MKKILVANRGEIARRVFRTCREMGIGTVAVYSDPDANASFVLEADEAVPIGGAGPSDSYLRTDLILAAAELTGADAIHPGYGFLSENAEFARACAQMGLTFIGPSADAIDLMGSKLTARELMQDAGVPVLPGRDLTGVTDLQAVAEDIGWPVLVKASYGGGGRGMRVVRSPAELEEAVSSARREAGAAFGNDTVFLEHYVDRPRHVEVQIFGDTFGTIVHLNERECSIQRRHQKIIEESPSPAVDERLRAAMGTAAVQAGKAIGYVGAGTVEFLLAPDGRFYFLEVNTRLQVEHPVTELVTGLDLVRLQIEVARGEPLPLGAQQPTIHGHAIEARLYAEDPLNDFLPAAGQLHIFDVPHDEGIRLDSGVESGATVSTNYDPMLAKVIAYGATRAEAVDRLARTLRRTRLQGVATNRSLLVGVLEHNEFASGDFDTHFLDRASISELVQTHSPGEHRAALIAAALAEQARQREVATTLTTLPSGFRNNASQHQVRRYLHGGDTTEVAYRLGRETYFAVDGHEVDTVLARVTSQSVDLVVEGIRRRFTIDSTDASVVVAWSNGSLELHPVPRFPEAEGHNTAGSLLAPMPATVVRVAVEPGDVVTAGQTVVVLEAMKMEHAVAAGFDATVGQVPVRVGQTVDTGQVLIILEEADDEEGQA